MKGCILCGGVVERQLQLGRMPLANGFLRPEQFADEFFYQLSVGCCEHCALVQLIDHVEPGRMFHDHYPFLASSSVAMQEHFRRLANDVAKRWLPTDDAFVVEIGSNDGTLLRYFAAEGIRHLGVEPSSNVAALARRNGVRVLDRFFNTATARDIAQEHGQADVILATNCFCHIRDLNSVADGARALLKPQGRLIFEDPYLGDIVRLAAYDQIYDEHACYFSVLSVSRWLTEHGLDLVDVQPQDVHGGSMRYVVAHRGSAEPTPAVAAVLKAEVRSGLDSAATLAAMQLRVDTSRDALLALLRNIRREGGRIVGYGATSKSTTLLNYCGITSDLVEFIADNTPDKQGRYAPGTHIPVRPQSAFSSPYPDYALLLAWNHEREILGKEGAFGHSGGRWIRYVPQVGVFSP